MPRVIVCAGVAGTVLAAMLVMGCGGAVRGAASPAADVAPAADPVMARFVDDKTVLVVRVDLGRLKPEAAEFLVRSLPPSIAQDDRAAAARGVREIFGSMRRPYDELARAGARRVYWLYNAGDPPGGDRESVVPFANIPVELVVPLDAGTDARAVGACLEAWNAGSVYYATERIGDAMVWGFKPVMSAIRNRKPAARPSLEAALNAAPDATVRVALIPTVDTLKQINEAWPALPAALGGGKTAGVSAGLQWAVAWLAQGEKLSGGLTAQYADADSANAAATALRPVVAAAVKLTGAATEPGAARALASVEPRADGDRVMLTADEAALSLLVASTVGRWASSALESESQWKVERGEIKHMMSQTHMTYLLLYARQHADAHGGAWPEDLRELEKAAGGKRLLDELLVNPAQPGRQPAYRYLKPPAGADPVKTVVLYEITDEANDRINVGFANEKIRVMTRRALDALLAR